VSRKVDLGLYLALAATFAGALWMAKDWPVDARMFPFLMAGAGLAMVFVALINQLRAWRRQNVSGEEGETVILEELAAFAWITGFFVSVALLGFQWGLPGMILIYLKVEGDLKWVLSSLFAACCWLFLYSMRVYLHLPLYDGFLLQDL